jgi:hypothetical protein
MGYELYITGYQHSGRSEKAWALAVELVGKGAKWRPDKSDMRMTRAMLTRVEPARLVAVARLLLDRGAADLPTVRRLFGTGKMRRRLGSEYEKVRSLLGMRRRGAEG